MSVQQPVAENHVVPSAPTTLTSGTLLAKNAIWNLLGAGSPVFVALFCLPILKTRLGVDRLGIISLAWVVVGYFGLFDFGLSRALTKLVAERLGQHREDEIPGLVWTSLFLMAGLGVAGAVLAFILTPWLVYHPLKVPAELRSETIRAFYWIAVSIPVVILTAGLRGVLEALQRFRLATSIRIPMGIFTYLGPVLVLPFSHSLVPVMMVLVAGRTIAGFAHLWACYYALPSLRGTFAVHASSIGPLFRFGTWMTVSNVVGPLMVSFDRFFIGALISVSAVAYYSIPSDVLLRVTILPAAICGVLFPAFSTTHEADRARLVVLLESSVKYIFFILFPIILLLIAFAPEALRLWLGADFAQHSSSVAQILAIAIFINGLALSPFAHVQGAGRPDITAKLHLLELPIYALMLVVFAKSMGIRGVAIAWLLRVVIDAALLIFFSWRLLRENTFFLTRLPVMLAGALVVFGSAAYLNSVFNKIIFVTTVLCVTMTVLWRWMLSAREKTVLMHRLERWVRL